MEQEYMNAEEPSPITRNLIDWYHLHKRDLPWRKTTDPYLIWISEIILQQTRVIQGLDYFNRFINYFPTVSSLASAHEDEVLKLWQGLGYYSRARNLHAAAKDIMIRFNGKFPTEYADVLSLKGIGEYTAAAICSFAFNLPHAVVDGNVYRVLSRLFDLDTPIDSTAGKKLFSNLAHKLLDKQHPNIFNQAIMDFGAIQCTPQSPVCNRCPLQDKCLSYALKQVSNRPVKQGKTVVKSRFFNYLYISHKGNTWIQQRTGNDIWRNLFEFILIETPEEVSFEKLIQTSEYKNIISDAGMITIVRDPILKKHVLSHRIINACFYTLQIEKESPALEQFKKIEISELEQYAISRLTQAYLEDLDSYSLW